MIDNNLINEIYDYVFSHYQDNYVYLKNRYENRDGDIDELIKQKAIKMSYVFNQMLANELTINIDLKGSAFINKSLYLLVDKKLNEGEIHQKIKEHQKYNEMTFEDEVEYRLSKNKIHENQFFLKPFSVSDNDEKNQYAFAGVAKIKQNALSFAMADFFYQNLYDENGQKVPKNIKELNQFKNDFEKMLANFLKNHEQYQHCRNNANEYDFTRIFNEYYHDSLCFSNYGSSSYEKRKDDHQFWKLCYSICSDIFNSQMQNANEKSDKERYRNFQDFVEYTDLNNQYLSYFSLEIMRDYYFELIDNGYQFNQHHHYQDWLENDARRETIRNWANNIQFIEKHNINTENYDEYVSLLNDYNQQIDERNKIDIIDEKHFNNLFDGKRLERAFSYWLNVVENEFLNKIKVIQENSYIIDLKEDEMMLLDEVREKIKTKYPFLYEKNSNIKDVKPTYEFYLSKDLNLSKPVGKDYQMVHVMNTRFYDADGGFLNEAVHGYDVDFSLTANGDDKNENDWIRNGWDNISDLKRMVFNADFLFPYLKADQTAYDDLVHNAAAYNYKNFAFGSKPSRMGKAEYYIEVRAVQNGLTTYQLSTSCFRSLPNILNIETSSTRNAQSGLTKGVYQAISDFAYKNNMIVCRNINDFSKDGANYLKNKSRYIREKFKNHLILDFYSSENGCSSYQATPSLDKKHIEEIKKHLPKYEFDLDSKDEYMDFYNKLNKMILEKIKEKTKNDEYFFIDVNYNTLFLKAFRTEIGRTRLDKESFKEVQKIYHQFYDEYKKDYYLKHNEIIKTMDALIPYCEYDDKQKTIIIDENKFINKKNKQDFDIQSSSFQTVKDCLTTTMKTDRYNFDKKIYPLEEFYNTVNKNISNKLSNDLKEKLQNVCAKIQLESKTKNKIKIK